MGAARTLRVLVADDEAAVRRIVERVVAEAGYEVVIAEDGAQALEQIGTRSFDVLVTDLHMPGADGFEVTAACRERQPDAQVIVMTGGGTIESAVRAMKLGARDYLTKPIDPDHLEALLARAVEDRELRRQNAHLSRLMESEEATRSLVGDSAPMNEVRRLVSVVAPSDASVLICGETGTGKELVARAIHAASERASGRFVPVNCAAFNAQLLESELFGHEAGSFTGANKLKLGLIEVAKGGTLFLDEVGETDPEFQVKLLRVLQEREFFRVGGTDPIAADVRIVAATNRDLQVEVADGRFREDLFFRLNVFPIPTPPLRERREDVVTIAEVALERIARRLGFERVVIAPESAAMLKRYRWPGNVRELENTLERAALLAGGHSIEPQHLPMEIAGYAPAHQSALHRLVDLPLKIARDRFDRSYVSELLREQGGNVSESARRSGMSRSSFHELMKRLKLDPDDYRGGGDGADA